MNDNDYSLRDYLKILRKRSKVVVVVFAAIFCIALMVSFLSTPIYEGSAKIIIERVETNLTGRARNEPRDPEFDKTQFQLIRSHAVARRVVKMLGIQNDYESRNSPGGGVFDELGTFISEIISPLTAMFSPDPGAGVTKSEEGWDDVDQVAVKLIRNLRVRPVQDSQIAEIVFESPNPEFAATVANTYVKAYLEEVLDMKMDATRRNLEWMTQKAESERLKLQSTEKHLQEYMKEHDLITLEDRLTIVPEKLAQLGRDLVHAETRTKEYKLLYDKAQGVSGNLDAVESVLSISEGSSLDVLRAQILKAEQNIMELSSKYGSKHPVMIKAAGDLNVLKKKRREEIQRLVAKIRGQYELALSNENSIRSEFEQTKAEAHVLNEKFVEYSALKGEIVTNRQLYDALLSKIKDQSITGETRPVNVWIVANAKALPDPIKPNVPLNLAIGIILGLGCGIGSAFLVNQIDNRIKSAEGVGEAFKLPVLGSISFNRHFKNLSEAIIKEPRSEYAESFNALRTTLLLSTPGTPPKKILVTSSVAGEGKTTTAVNLALTMAKSGSRVVLIDADMRKPNIHKIFKLQNTIGLSNYLTGAANSSVLNKGSHEKLVVITAGQIPPNPYELINSSRMISLLEKLEHEFDVIICDSPPVLSVADSRVLSQMFNGLILVARAGLTSYPMARNCIRLLTDAKAHIFGVLVNAVHESDQEDYYHYYTSYFEQTGQKDSEGKKLSSGAQLKTAVSRQDK